MCGTWDVDGLLEEMPESLFAEWQAMYELRPWDAPETWALIEGGFKRPDWLEDVVEVVTAKMKKKAKRRSQTSRSILRSARKSGPMMGWTWP